MTLQVTQQVALQVVSRSLQVKTSHKPHYMPNQSTHPLSLRERARVRAKYYTYQQPFEKEGTSPIFSSEAINLVDRFRGRC